MEQKIGISRAFRPKRFDEVIGQEATVKALQNSLIRHQVGSVYLFSGIRGTGKTTFARLFAKAINCEGRDPSGEPCNKCGSCLEISAGSSLEVIEIDGASNRGIEDARRISEITLFAPIPGRFKIFIIDEVHMLTREAFNALLKTLEEPPAHAKFLLATTEPSKLPLTILSRCQRFSLLRIEAIKIEAKLEKVMTSYHLPFEKGALAPIAQMAEGSMRDAESMLEKVLSLQGDEPLSANFVCSALGLLPPTFFAELDAAILGLKRSLAPELAESLWTRLEEPSQAVELLLAHFKRHLLASASPYSSAEIGQFLQILMDALLLFTRLPIRKLHMEMVLFQLIDARSRLPLEEILRHFAGQQPITITPAAPTTPNMATVEVVKGADPTLAKADLPVVASSEPPLEAPVQRSGLSEKARDTHLMNFSAAILGGNLNL